MARKFILSVVAVFATWAVIDFIIHGVILQSTYHATAQLWRTMEEMRTGLLYLVTFITALSFVGLYVLLVSPKSMLSGIKYGLLLGVAYGVPMGFGSYSFMPIPFSLAFTWFMGSLVETVVGGVIVGTIFKGK